MSKNTYTSFPDVNSILDFIKNSKGKVSKREIARAFHIRGQDKIMLKKALREMIEDGIITQDSHKNLIPAGQLPAVQVVEFAGTDKEGNPLVKLLDESGRDTKVSPTIYLMPERGRRRGKSGRDSAMGADDKALVRLTLINDDPPTYRARMIKKISSAPRTMLGIYKGNENGGRVHPCDKKNRDEVIIDIGHSQGAEDGELVLIELLPKTKRGRSLGLKAGRVRERVGDVSDARSISLIAIHAHDIPNEFPSDVIAEAQEALPVELGKRSDLREIPLITIDPADARDHDDALWAEADDDPENPGGWHVIVAIADVAHYVTPDSLLDREARKRGNSCYFPDRVVSMLPENLSAGLCSLMPGEDRATIAVHIWYDQNGKKLRHKFVRGVMRSAANISYTQAQDAIDGRPDHQTEPLLDPVLKPLYGAYAALVKAREKRAPLDLDLPERQIQLNKFGIVEAITLRDRFDAHRLVEEFMVSANVCAAEELEKYHMACMYRVHEEPSMDKMEALRSFLKTLDLPLAKGQVLKPNLFNGILERVKDTNHEIMVNQVVLRSQTQAYYSPDNMGHFGLSLAKYAHFTSPIRRYSDLLVHRGLITALGFGPDGLSDYDKSHMDEIGDHISQTERRAMAAERESTDRYLASYLSSSLQQEFAGRISSVARFGLFVTLEPSGGDGLIPIAEIGGDYYHHDEEAMALIGERTGHRFRLGDKVTVKLIEANQFTGGLRLELAGDSIPPSSGRERGRGYKSRRNNSGGRSKSSSGKPWLDATKGDRKTKPHRKSRKN